VLEKLDGDTLVPVVESESGVVPECITITDMLGVGRKHREEEE